jgi:ribosomal protein S18 acetylase RimI-like enzyme
LQKISVRQAAEKDHEEVVSMWWDFQKEHGDLFGYFCKLNEENKSRFSKWSKERVGAGEVLLPEAGGRIAGYVLFEEMQFPLELVRKCATICDVYIKPEFRRNGAAENAIKECFSILKSRGFELVRLTVTAGNEKAERLYEKAGFKVMNKQLEKKL